jgi:hypothetical protein
MKNGNKDILSWLEGMKRLPPKMKVSKKERQMRNKSGDEKNPNEILKKSNTLAE